MHSVCYHSVSGESVEARLCPLIQLPLEESTLKEIVEKAKDWALMHGAGMRSKTNFSKDALQFAPFALIPSVFPRKEFQKAVEIQPLINELMHKVAYDHEFLSSSLKSTLEVDDFTRKLYEIYETVRKEGTSQKLTLGLIRCDIMLEKCCSEFGWSAPYCCWKQVEVNTIASGFGWLGPVSALIHRYVLQELGMNNKIKNLPCNLALEGLCESMIEAWKLYGEKGAVIMFLVEDITYNICDQRFHEFKIRELNPDIKVIRRSLTEIGKSAYLGSNKELFIDGYQVALVYFRSGYHPGQYHTSVEWEARLMVERSRAIKCPNINYHLAGTKKVQQALANTDSLMRFITNEEHIKRIQGIFTGLYALDMDANGDEAVARAMRNPERYVLKPQREGGGNNVYGVDIKHALEIMKESKERSGWILMDRICPPLQKNYIVRPGSSDVPKLTDVVSELGIFGVVIGDAQHITLNKQLGHMLRTKLSDADEGGVASGAGALDSPYLID